MSSNAYQTKHLKLINICKYFTIVFLWTIFEAVFAQTPSINTLDDSQLLDNYIKSKGYYTPIIFDSSNIKQYWTNLTVFAKDQSINILLNPNNLQAYESDLLKFQLINVSESQDCVMDVITKESDVSFLVANSKNKILSQSHIEEDFLQYHIASAAIHWEDIQDSIFTLQFVSNSNRVSICKVILSFPPNKSSSFLSSPGVLKLNKENIYVSQGKLKDDDAAIQVTGKQSNILSKKNILVSDKKVSCSVKVKNMGNTSTRIYVGYGIYSKERVRLDGRNYPFSNTSNEIVKVVSQNSEDNSIIVDSYPQWTKGCYLALDAKEDFSDIPNEKLVESKILSVTQLDDGTCKITMDSPIKTIINAGTSVRVHGKGGAFLYTGSKVLAPGEEEVFSSEIAQDVTFYHYSPKAISKGVYYLKPIVRSFSSNPQDENTVLITNYIITY